MRDKAQERLRANAAKVKAIGVHPKYRHRRRSGWNITEAQWEEIEREYDKEHSAPNLK
jgi:hypothetical protein